MRKRRSRTPRPTRRPTPRWKRKPPKGRRKPSRKASPRPTPRTAARTPPKTRRTASNSRPATEKPGSGRAFFGERLGPPLLCVLGLEQLPNVYAVNRRAGDDSRPRGNGDASDGGSGETRP